MHEVQCGIRFSLSCKYMWLALWHLVNFMTHPCIPVDAWQDSRRSKKYGLDDEWSNWFCWQTTFCMFIPEEIIPRHFYCKEYGFVFPAHRWIFLRRRAIGRTMNFSRKLLRLWNWSCLFVSSIGRSQVSNMKHGCWSHEKNFLFSYFTSQHCLRKKSSFLHL